MQYYVYGPYEMAREDGGLAISRRRDDKKAFWAAVDQGEKGLPEACGCYVLVIRGVAWYVGLAAAQGFRQEIFQHHKLLLYSEALRKVGGRAQFIFIAKATPSDRFSKPSKNGHRDIRWLEQLLIGLAIVRNDGLRNIKDTKLLREMHVPGIINSNQGEGRATSVQALRRAVGV